MQLTLQGNKMAAARKGKKRPEVGERKWTDIEPFCARTLRRDPTVNIRYKRNQTRKIKLF